MEIVETRSTPVAVATAVLNLLNLWTAAGAALPADQLTYILSGAHLTWTEPGDRARATASGEYAARNVVPTRMAMRHDGTLYVAMPRFKRGVPFTLGVVEYVPYRSAIEPSISPYPCAAAHQPATRTSAANSTVVNVVDVYMDDADVLWALDVGKVNLLEKAVVVRPPMVFAFDTDTDEIIRAIDLSRATTAASCLQSIVVDHSSTTGPFVYVSDVGMGNVIAYNVGCDRSFKVHVPAGDCGRRDVMYTALAQVDVMDTAAGGGVAHYRRLYVTYLSATDMMYVPLQAVGDSTVGLATVTIGRKPCKMIVLGTDRGSLVYFRTADASDILSWDVNTEFSGDNFRLAHRGRNAYRIPLMVTVGFSGYQWFMESNFVDFLTGHVGCLGVSTRIQPLLRDCAAEDNPCAASTSCGDPGPANGTRT